MVFPQFEQNHLYLIGGSKQFSIYQVNVQYMNWTKLPVPATVGPRSDATTFSVSYPFSGLVVVGGTDSGSVLYDSLSL